MILSLVENHFDASQLKRHVFLTGPCGSGKSTIIQKVLASFDSKVQVGGFSTYFNSLSPINKYLYLSPFSKTPVGTQYNEENLVLHWTPEHFTVFTKVFNTLGTTLIQEARKKSDVLIMDECGRFEADCTLFKNEIFNCLDTSLPVLGVIRQLGYPSWLDDIKNHKNVSVIDTTTINQIQLISILTEHFSSFF